MPVRPFLVLLGVMLAGPLVSPTAGAAAGAKSRQAAALKTFRSCAELVRYGARNLPPQPPRTVDEPRRDLPAAAPAPEAGGGDDQSSTTNVQEVGVDEPDVVKGEGTTLFALQHGALHAVDARLRQPRLLGRLELEDGWGQAMLVRGGRAYVFGGVVGGTLIAEVDVRDPAAMKIVRTQRVEGSYVDARQTGRTARVVLTSQPDAIGGSAKLRGRPGGWLPESKFKSRRTGRTTSGRAVGCRAVARPARFAGAGILTVLTIDLEKGLPAIDADAIFTSADTVYASPASLYVATRTWAAGADQAASGATELHRFDVSDPDSTTYRASGRISGTLLNQFALSEHAGVLRAASTTGDGAESESRVTTLAERDGRLVELGSVGGLGRGERIYAVRFLGDVGYVVTFRQTDPLYTVDLADPARPRVLGELKIRGYSAYLHPIAEDLVLGVGQDATETGRRLGLQLALFDVSDLSAPKRLHQISVGANSSSSAEYDHHAFLWWPAAKLAVVPVDGDFTGALGFRVDRTGIAPAGRVEHPGPSGPASVDRSIVLGGTLLTMSRYGVRASTPDSLADQGWAAFPQPPRHDRPAPIP